MKLVVELRWYFLIWGIIILLVFISENIPKDGIFNCRGTGVKEIKIKVLGDDWLDYHKIMKYQYICENGQPVLLSTE